MKTWILVLGAAFLVLIALVLRPVRIETRHLNVTAQLVKVDALDLLRIGFHTELFGVEDPRCGLLKEGFFLGRDVSMDPNKISVLKKGRLLFTLGAKPRAVVLSGDMIEIQCDVFFDKAENKNELYVFCIQGDISQDSKIYITP